MFNENSCTKIHCVNVCTFSAIGVLFGLVALPAHYGLISPDAAKVVFGITAIFWMPYWISAALRCADALNELKTTLFVSERLPPLIYAFFAAGGFLSVRYLPGTMAFVVLVIGCANALSFFACGSLVRSDMKREHTGTAAIDAMNALGGIFGILVARFTFKNAFVMRKVAVRVPTVLLAIAFLLAMPFVMGFVLRQPEFSDLAPYNLRTPEEQRLLAPLDKFTGPLRPVGPPMRASDYPR